MELKSGEQDSLLKKIRRKLWVLQGRASSPYHYMASHGVFLRDNERKLADLRDKHKDARCFIIGNGPSLNLLDLTKLKNEFTFGVNAIYMNYEKMGFYPTYYVVEDTFVAEDRSSEINSYKESIKFFGSYLNYCLHPDSKTLRLNVRYDYRPYPDFPNFSENALKEVWVGGTVTYLALQLAFYMGFKEVYMIGFDHNYKIPDDLIKTNKGISFESASDDPNHFHPDYFGKGYRWHDPKVERMELSFMKARKHFEKSGRVIYNATAGGKLEVFKRVDYHLLF